jgi:integrase
MEQLTRCLELAKQVNESTYLACAIGAYSGCRITEVRNLQWEDSIDFDAGTLTVTSRRADVKNKISATTPKSEASHRTIPLFPELKKVLLNHRQKKGYIVHCDGKKVARDPFRLPNEIPQIRKGLKLPWFSFHNLRHTFASLLLNQGLDLAIVSKLMGHGSVQITFDTYFHMLPNMYKDVSLTKAKAKAKG